jgi:hypothetical protein
MSKTIEEEKREEEARKKAEEELVNKDTKGFTGEQMNDYIDKLKDENARRRIANKRVQENLDKQKEEHEDAQKELDESQKKLKEFEDKEKEKGDKDKTENEKLAVKVADLEKIVNKSKHSMEKLTKDLSAKDKKIQKQDREVLIDRLVRKMEFEFSSDYEREGFMSSLNDVHDDGSFSFNDEEVIFKVKEFVKGKKKAPNTPGAGPGERSTETPLAEEIKGLLAKKTLTSEDNKRLDALLEEVES